LLGYAFNSLNLRKVRLNHYEGNIRGRACYDAVGFKETGRQREHAFIGGKWLDCLTMEIFREDFLAAEARLSKKKG